MAKLVTSTGTHVHKVVPPKEWTTARKALLVKEKKFTRLRDQLNQQRRDLPWVKVDKNYIFDGPKGKETLVDLKRLNIQDKVVFTGAVPPDDVPSHIAAADVCVGVFRDTKVTSCKSPLKIVEYMAMAKGIVANRVGEVTHMLDGAGVLVGSEDSSSLAQGIISLIDDKPLRGSLGRKARQNAEKTYNWAVTAQSILRAYEKSV